MTVDELALGIYNHHETFAESYYEIVDPDGINVSFKSLTLGRRISQLMRNAEATNTSTCNYMVVVKPRRGYCTAHITSEFHRRTAFRRGIRSWIVAQQQSTAEAAWEYAQQYEEAYRRHLYGSFDDDGNMIVEPDPACVIDILARKNPRAGSTRLSWAGRSFLAAGTAQNPNAMRGKHANHLLLTEAAYYGAKFEAMLKACLACVPKTPGNWCIMESTASGQGTGFHKLWLDAISRKSGWIPCFVGTHEIERYRMPVRPDLRAKVMDRFKPLTLERMRQYRLDVEQALWFETVLRDEHNGDIDSFRAEYPYDWEEAFVASGRTYFDMRVVGSQPTTEPAMTGRLVWDDEIDATRKRIVFEPRTDHKGWLRIWRLPERHRAYYAGADTSRGQDTYKGKGSKQDPDYSALSIHDLESGEQVATLHARLAPLSFAEQLNIVCRFYNFAFLTLEINENGLSVMQYLREDLLFPPQRLYQRRTKERPDLLRPDKLEAFGWVTSEATRTVLLQNLVRALRDGDMFLRDPIFKSELSTCIILPNGRPEAAPGCHDDTIFAAALAEEGRQQAMMVHDASRRQQEEENRGVERFRRYRPVESR